MSGPPTRFAFRRDRGGEPLSLVRTTEAFPRRGTIRASPRRVNVAATTGSSCKTSASLLPNLTQFIATMLVQAIASLAKCGKRNPESEMTIPDCG